MEGQIILAGLILSLLLVMLYDQSTNEKLNKKSPEEKKTTTNAYRNMRMRQLFPYVIGYRSHDRLADEVEMLRRMQRRQSTWELHGLWSARKDRGSDFVRIWRNSIAGLVRLAKRNLELANRHLSLQDYKNSVEAAGTSVENIARALIYCYGDKPNPTSGQEEALDILSRRFKGDEKTELEKTIGTVTRIDYYQSALKYVSKHNVQTQLFDDASTDEIFESASTVVDFFERIILERFGEEIPELLSCDTQ